MNALRKKINQIVENIKNGQSKGAQRTMLEELFNDFYAQRHQVYKMNFFRGIFFGLGSVLGGTIVLGLIVWIISLFVNFPVVGQFFQDTQNSLEQTVKSE